MSTSTPEIAYIIATSLTPQLILLVFIMVGLLSLFTKALK